MGRMRAAVLISGRGSNLKALLDACAGPGFPAEIVTVLSDSPAAGGLAFAREAGVPATVIARDDFSDRAGFESALDTAAAAADAEVLCLAGFMRLLGAPFLDRWPDRVINIHPSLLPAFRGLDTHARVLAAGARITGCTVHFVRPAMDAGPIIIQAAVPVLPTDDAGTLAARVLTAEHRCFPTALRWLAEGRLRIDDERVAVAGAEPMPSPGMLVSPGC